VTDIDIDAIRRRTEQYGVKPWTEDMHALLAEVERLLPYEQSLLCGEASVLRHERDEARAEVERLQYVEHDLANAREAGAAYKRLYDNATDTIARVEALCDEADAEAVDLDYIDGEGGLTTSEVRAAIKG
jgi:hypothetical protein